MSKHETVADARRRLALIIIKSLGQGDPEEGKGVLKSILDAAASSGHTPAFNLVASNGEWVGGESGGDIATDSKLRSRTPAIYDQSGGVVQESVSYVDLTAIGNELGINATRKEHGVGIC